MAGPDVWEIVRDVRATRAAEPGLSAAELVALVESNTGVDARMLGRALTYWPAHPGEIEGLLDEADRVERAPGGSVLRTTLEHWLPPS